MTRVYPAACLGVLILSGCLSGSDQTSTPQNDESTPLAAPSVDDNTGGVFVRVVNTELNPVSGADVALTEPAQSTRTNQMGEARFGSVLPGRYTLIATAPGYEGTGKKVDVIAGSVTEVRLVLEPIQVPEPRHENRVFNGLWSCWFAAAGSQDSCANLVYPDKTIVSYVHGKAWNTTVIEVLITRNALLGVAGTDLQVSATTCAGGFRSLQPFRAEYQVNVPLPARPRSPASCSGRELLDGPLNVVFLFWPWAGPNPTDAAVIFQQGFAAYTTIFYIEPPPPGFSALPDR